MKRAIVSLSVAFAVGLVAPAAWALRDMQSPQASFVKSERCKPASRWDYGGDGWLQACVAMGTADYCSADRANTLWGTPVIIFDVDHADPGDRHQPTRGGHEQWVEYNPASPKLYFEAAWRPFWAKGKDRGSPLCLSKKRWATLPINGPCPDLLPDPRVVQKARFCEDLVGVEIALGALEANDPAALAALRAQGGLIFNKSAFLDAGLHLWTDGAHLLSSTHGLDLGPASPASEAPGFARGYVPARTMAAESMVGVILSDNLRWLIEHLDTVESDEPENAIIGLAGLSLKPLVTYKLATGGFVTTRHRNLVEALPVSASFSEGWLFDSEGDALAALRVMGEGFGGTPAQIGKLVRWERCARGGGCAPADRQFATAVVRPPAGRGPAWRAAAVEGYVLRAVR